MIRSITDMLNVTIGWEWALGIFGLLILIAWKGSARFAALETSMQWVKDILHELKVKMTMPFTQKINGMSAIFGSTPQIAFNKSKPYLR